VNESHERWLAEQMLKWARSEYTAMFQSEFRHASFAGYLFAKAEMSLEEHLEIVEALNGSEKAKAAQS